MRRPPRARADRRALLGLVGAVVLGVAWVGSTTSDRADAAACGPAPAGRVAVAVVVDDGSSPSVRCVEVPDRATGYDALIAAGHTLRIEAGFLCAIDGVPATGCGNRPDWNGAYWRYFHAAPGGSWSYSTVGGGGYRMPPRCAIEGWRYSDAPGTGVAPRVAPPVVACDALAPPPSTTRPAPVPGPTPTAPRGPTSPGAAPTPPAGASGSAPGADGSVPAPSSPGAGPTGESSDPSDPSTSREAGESAEDVVDPSAGSDPTDPDAAGASGAGAGDDSRAAPLGDSEVLGAAVEAPSGPGGGSPVGTVVALGLVGLLAVAAAAGARRRGSGRSGEQDLAEGA